MLKLYRAKDGDYDDMQSNHTGWWICDWGLRRHTDLTERTMPDVLYVKLYKREPTDGEAFEIRPSESERKMFLVDRFDKDIGLFRQFSDYLGEKYAAGYRYVAFFVDA